jgi:hypothetical protein
MYHLLYQSTTLHFEFVGFVWFSAYTGVISLNSNDKLIAVMVKGGVLFEVQAKFLTEKKKITETSTDNCISFYCTVLLFQMYPDF